MTIGQGIAVAAVCAVPIAAMFAPSVSGDGLVVAFLFAAIATLCIVIST